MRVIIVGSGRVGAGIASQLAEGGHEVVILDIRTESFRRLAPGFSGQALRGDGTDTTVLERAGARECEWFFALTNGDNRNILAAQLAKENFGIPHVLCKINDPVRSQAYSTLGIDTINRTEMMIDTIGRYMGKPAIPGAGDVTVAVVPPAPVTPETQAQMAAGEPVPAAPVPAAPSSTAAVPAVPSSTAAPVPATPSSATPSSAADQIGGR